MEERPWAIQTRGLFVSPFVSLSLWRLCRNDGEERKDMGGVDSQVLSFSMGSFRAMDHRARGKGNFFRDCSPFTDG